MEAGAAFRTVGVAEFGASREACVGCGFGRRGARGAERAEGQRAERRQADQGDSSAHLLFSLVVPGSFRPARRASAGERRRRNKLRRMFSNSVETGARRVGARSLMAAGTWPWSA